MTAQSFPVLSLAGEKRGHAPEGTKVAPAAPHVFVRSVEMGDERFACFRECMTGI